MPWCEKIRAFGFLFGVWILLGGTLFSEEWERVLSPRKWEFPRDHGAHREFKTEWWYFTGNVATPEGRPFGYQLTIFRQGIQRNPPMAKSAWTAREFFFGHFAISDLKTEKFFCAEALDRGALKQAGASNEKMEAWIGDWKISTVEKEVYHLQATRGGSQLDLTVEPAKSLIFQGDRGLSQKGAQPGNASHYYSYPRLRTKGKLTMEGKTYSVSGESWFDHEFSTSALDANQAGWDWFSLQMDSGEEAMIYTMRTLNGKIDPQSNATWVGRDGKTILLKQDEYEVEKLREWTSSRSGTKYPSAWRIRIPKLQVEMTVKPRMSDQELVLKDLSKITYWEGACEVEGVHAGKAVKGFGYTELTGYAGPIGFGMKEKP